MRFTVWAVASCVLAAAVVQHALATREQFYPAVIYLATSKLSIVVLGNLAVLLLVVFARLVKRIFLGDLRPREVERVTETLRYTIPEVCIALTLFREELSPRVLSLFGMLLFSKFFHASLEERINAIEVQGLAVFSRVTHARLSALMASLFVMNAQCLAIFSSTLIDQGASVLFLFAAEYALLELELVRIGYRYAIALIASRMPPEWPARSLLLMSGKLAVDIARLFTTCIYFYLLSAHYGMPIIMVRDLVRAAVDVHKELSNLLAARALRRQIHTLFVTPSEEDIATRDALCVVCHEDVLPAAADRAKAKKLPCGHIFHTNCLLPWWERQQNCPTCRADLGTMLRTAARNAAADAARVRLNGGVAGANAAAPDAAAAVMAVAPAAPPAAPAIPPRGLDPLPQPRAPVPGAVPPTPQPTAAAAAAAAIAAGGADAPPPPIARPDSGTTPSPSRHSKRVSRSSRRSIVAAATPSLEHRGESSGSDGGGVVDASLSARIELAEAQLAASHAALVGLLQHAPRSSAKKVLQRQQAAAVERQRAAAAIAAASPVYSPYGGGGGGGGGVGGGAAMHLMFSPDGSSLYGGASPFGAAFAAQQQAQAQAAQMHAMQLAFQAQQAQVEQMQRIMLLQRSGSGDSAGPSTPTTAAAAVWGGGGVGLPPSMQQQAAMYQFMQAQAQQQQQQVFAAQQAQQAQAAWLMMMQGIQGGGGGWGGGVAAAAAAAAAAAPPPTPPPTLSPHPLTGAAAAAAAAAATPSGGGGSATPGAPPPPHLLSHLQQLQAQHAALQQQLKLTQQLQLAAAAGASVPSTPAAASAPAEEPEGVGSPSVAETPLRR